MSLPSPSHSSWRAAHAMHESFAQMPTLVTTLLLCSLIIVLSTMLRRKNRIPLANPPKTFQFQISKQMEFIKNGMTILSQNRKKFNGKPFRLLTEMGDVAVIPSQFIDAIRNDERLDFAKAVAMDFSANLPGFETFGVLLHDGHVLQSVVRKQLTKYLNTVTEPLSEETTFATNHIFGNSPEWQEICIKDSILDLISRISSRVFLGDQLCRNEAWLKITKEYTVNCFKAALQMTVFPGPLRYLISWFSPGCKLVRRQLNEARQIVTPILEQRRAIKAQASADGKPPPKFNDAIDWAEAECGGKPYDPATFQLVLSFAAIHTTTNLLCQTMVLLANEPELIEPLRQEMIDVLKAEGWKKSALFNMKLLDSALKEVQRCQPNSMIPMRRVATQDVQLPDGSILLKGQRTVVDGFNMVNPEIYENPEKFDIYRFLRMREEPGKEHKAHLVATSPNHLTFGHGMHACPGRFFAANESKIALCHLLLKYDWKLAPGTRPEPLYMAASMTPNPANKLLFRRRKEEIDLESLEFV